MNSLVSRPARARIALLLISLLLCESAPVLRHSSQTIPAPEETSPTFERRRATNSAATATHDTSPTTRVGQTGSEPSSRDKSVGAYAKLPLAFEANRGQYDGDVKFAARGSGFSLLLYPTGAALALAHGRRADEQATADSRVPAPARRLDSDITFLTLSFDGASPRPGVSGSDELPGKSHYLNGDRRKRWRRNVPLFGRVHYRGLYPGVDMLYYGNRGQLEYDFVVSPGADPGAIRLKVGGAEKVEVDARGDLVMHTSAGEVVQRRPLIYQEVGGARNEVEGGYRVEQGNVVGFRVGRYDPARPLVIDPVLVYSTYLGGAAADEIRDIATDAQGNVYVTGYTVSTNFPTANPFQPSFGGETATGNPGDAFVAKINAAGTALVYSTYIGGHGGDQAYGLAVDSEGRVFLTGRTASLNFPTTAGAFMPEWPRSNADSASASAFVTKLSADGSSLVYSTYIGAAGTTNVPGVAEARDIAIDAQGNAYVTGNTSTPNFPTKDPIQGVCNCNVARTGVGIQPDLFVTKLNAAGSALVFSTFYGGINYEEAEGIALDPSGNVYVTGQTVSNDFPTVHALQPAFAGRTDAFVLKLNAPGTSVAYSTYLGGSGDENFFRTINDSGTIVADAAGNAYVTGLTTSTDFPVKNALQPSNGGPGIQDTFISKFSPDGASLGFSTYLGGRGHDWVSGIALDASGNIYVAGETNSDDFPVTGNALQSHLGGATDAFLTKLDAAGSALVYSTYFGSVEDDKGDEATCLAVDALGTVYVGGVTNSVHFPTANPLQAARGGTEGSLFPDGFIFKIAGPTPFITYINSTPARGGNTGTTSVLIAGSGFAPGATVKLQRAGRPDISGGFVRVNDDGTGLTTVFDLTGAAAGAWDILITNPDGVFVRRPGGFTVEPGREPQLWADVVGLNRIRSGRERAFHVFYGNRGNTDAYAVPLWIGGIPKGARWKVHVNVLRPESATSDTINWDEVPLHVERGDTVAVPLIIPVVPAGSAKSIKLSLTIQGDSDFTLKAWTTSPLLRLAQAGASPPAAHADGLLEGGLSEGGFAFTPYEADCLREALPVAMEKILVEKILPAFFGDCLTLFTGVTFSNLTRVVTQAVENGGPPTDEQNVMSMRQVVLDAAVAALKCGVSLLPEAALPRAVLISIKVIDLIYDVGNGVDILRACVIPAATQPNPPRNFPVRAVTAMDPNDKVGSAGAGPARYASGGEPLRYAVFFENKETATAPAEEVVITDQLDLSRADISTFDFGPVAFGSRSVSPPPGARAFSTDVDLRPSRDLLVRITGALDAQTGRVTWRLASLDPATGQPPTDPLAGFLPPNLNAPEGEGGVTFTVMPKGGLATGVEVRNSASIVFDANAPIVTPEWFNTIDNTAPESRVLPLPARQISSAFAVGWAGTDAGAGVMNYTVYVSENGGPYALWLKDTTATSAVYEGQPNKTYSFYSVAKDAANNEEASPSSADALTATPPIALQFEAAAFDVGEGAGSRQVTVTRSGLLDPVAVNFATAGGTASDRSDYTPARGTLAFGTGETSKTFTVLITDDGLVEGDEIINLVLSEPAGAGAGLGNLASAVLTIVDNDTAATPNPIDSTQFFVRQHYHDFLNREPDAGGLDFWTNEIEQCGSDLQCREVKRINVSAAFFLSIEFQQTGYLAYRARKAAFGNIHSKPVPITLGEMFQDIQVVGSGVVVNADGWEQKLEQNKRTYFDQLAAAQRFTSLYPRSLTPEQFADALNANAGGALSQAERDALVAGLKSGAKTRAQALRVVAEDSDLVRMELNRAFVLMQYFGYLRRDPDDLPDHDFSGWQFWLDKLDQFNGNFIQAEMVKAFISSDEYRKRFGL